MRFYWLVLAYASAKLIATHTSVISNRIDVRRSSTNPCLCAEFRRISSFTTRLTPRCPWFSCIPLSASSSQQNTRYPGASKVVHPARLSRTDRTCVQKVRYLPLAEVCTWAAQMPAIAEQRCGNVSHLGSLMCRNDAPFEWMSRVDCEQNSTRTSIERAHCIAVIFVDINCTLVDVTCLFYLGAVLSELSKAGFYSDTNYHLSYEVFETRVKL